MLHPNYKCDATRMRAGFHTHVLVPDRVANYPNNKDFNFVVKIKNLDSKA